MLELRDIHKYYTVGQNRLHVLQGIDLSIGSGELVAIMGSAQSTLMNIIGLLDDYDSGEYRLGGELMKNLSEARAAQLRNRHLPGARHLAPAGAGLKVDSSSDRDLHPREPRATTLGVDHQDECRPSLLPFQRARAESVRGDRYTAQGRRGLASAGSDRTPSASCSARNRPHRAPKFPALLERAGRAAGGLVLATSPPTTAARHCGRTLLCILEKGASSQQVTGCSGLATFAANDVSERHFGGTGWHPARRAAPPGRG